MLYFLLALIALLGSFIQSTSGFGYAIICMALWPLLVPVRTASVMELLTAVVVVGFIAWRLRRHINFKLLLWPLLASSVTSILGVFTLMANTESLIRRILGGVLIILSLYFAFFSDKIRIKPTRASGITAGLLSGFCSGLFSIGGPPMVAYFLAVIGDKQEYNATLQCYFVVTTLYTFLIHLLVGNVTWQVLQYSFASLGGLVIGTALGLKVFQKLSMAHLKKLVYLLLAGMGVYLVIAG